MVEPNDVELRCDVWQALYGVLSPRTLRLDLCTVWELLGALSVTGMSAAHVVSWQRVCTADNYMYEAWLGKVAAGCVYRAHPANARLVADCTNLLFMAAAREARNV